MVVGECVANDVPHLFPFIFLQSLSAAHTLAADTNGIRGNEGAAGGRDKLPVHLQKQLDDIMGAGKSTGKQQGEGNGTPTASPDVIQNAVIVRIAK